MVEDLTIAYGDTIAVNAATFTVSAGEVVALLGANGAGKTSTLEAIEGYRTPTSGSITVFGQSPRDAIGQGRVGVQLQSDGLAPGARTHEVLDLFVRLHPAGPTAAELIDLLGLSKIRGTAVRRLSGGEHRRLAVALALVGTPELLLLDEPTAGVDADGRSRIVDVIRSRRDDGVGVLLTTHEMDLVHDIADRVIVMDRGQVIHSGSLDDLVASKPRVRFTTEPAIDPADLATALGQRVHRDGSLIVVEAARTNELIGQILSFCDTHGVAVGNIDDGSRDIDQILRGRRIEDSERP